VLSPLTLIASLPRAFILILFFYFKERMMSKIKIMVGILAVFMLGGFGCSSNTSSSSGFGSGSGYSINLTAAQTIVPLGGQTTLIAAVKDAQGNPVNDSSRGVTFSSTLGATITQPTTIVGGVSSTIYTAPAAGSGTVTAPATGVDQVTASYQGAVAYVSIFVVRQ
jgi:hypothetical protein